jgi:hypothetical protein
MVALLLGEGALLVRGLQKATTSVVHVLENIILLHLMLVDRGTVA